MARYRDHRRGSGRVRGGPGRRPARRRGDRGRGRRGRRGLRALRLRPVQDVHRVLRRGDRVPARRESGRTGRPRRTRSAWTPPRCTPGSSGSRWPSRPTSPPSWTRPASSWSAAGPGSAPTRSATCTRSWSTPDDGDAVRGAGRPTCSSPPGPTRGSCRPPCPTGERILTWRDVYDLPDAAGATGRGRLRGHRGRVRQRLPGRRGGRDAGLQPGPGDAARGPRRGGGGRARCSGPAA